MSTRSQKRGVTLVEVVVVIIVIGILIALLLPTIRSSREAVNRNTCEHKMVQLTLALLNFESAHKALPPISRLSPTVVANSATTPLPPLLQNAKPGGTTAGVGWSWIVSILPNIEENNLYKNILSNSSEFTIADGPFAATIYNGVSTHKPRPPHVATVTLPDLICPSWAGNANTNSNTTIDTTSTGAPEYNANFASAAPTNYKAVLGTQIVNNIPIEDGGMLLSDPSNGGTTLRAFKDGTSKTFLIAETQETGYASWYDGTLNWVVTGDPSTGAQGTQSDGSDNTLPPWVATPVVSIQKGYNPSLPKGKDTSQANFPYLLKGAIRSAPANDINWGPSSSHPGSIVHHGFADGHIIGLSDAVDPATYLSLTTRNGAEQIDESKMR